MGPWNTHKAITDWEEDSDDDSIARAILRLEGIGDKFDGELGPEEIKELILNLTRD